ncbi:MAG TPA: DUF2461 domain-containing protein [Candidatus Limnocylindria bacterium]|nr:DUF2461 domain-containing protein [Candidatus Limnocylindria bacterium]
MDEPSRFEGFQPAAIQFLVDLAAHNDRAWFQPRKQEYERLLKGPMQSLVAALGDRFRARGIPLEADPRKSIFRIYRDTRFAKDKSPYKTNVGASLPWVDGDQDPDERVHGNGAYLHFQPGNSFAGGGMYMAEKARLDALRVAVVEDPARVRAALEDPAFLATFGPVSSHESLKRVPPGYPADHQMSDLLRAKDVTFGRRLTDEEFLSPDLPDRLAEDFATAIPVFRFLATLRA